MKPKNMKKAVRSLIESLGKKPSDVLAKDDIVDFVSHKMPAMYKQVKKSFKKRKTRNYLLSLVAVELGAFLLTKWTESKEEVAALPERERGLARPVAM